LRDLLAHGAKADAPSANGTTALEAAVTIGNTVCVRELLRYGADPNLRNTNGPEVAIRAATVGRHLVWHDLLFCKGTWTPLMVASIVGDTAAVRELLRRGADPNLRDKSGRTALMEAAYDGRAGIVRDLLAAGADPDAKDNNGDTARALFIKSGRGDVAGVLDHWPRRPGRRPPAGRSDERKPR